MHICHKRAGPGMSLTCSGPETIESFEESWLDEGVRVLEHTVILCGVMTWIIKSLS